VPVCAHGHADRPRPKRSGALSSRSVISPKTSARAQVPHPTAFRGPGAAEADAGIHVDMTESDPSVEAPSSGRLACSLAEVRRAKVAKL
jgi:hypothetical protein